MKLDIKVIPSSSKDCIAGWLEDTLKIKVKAPPEKGRANKSVINLLEKNLDLAKGSVEITSGANSSRKIVEVDCSSNIDIKKKLAAIGNKKN